MKITTILFVLFFFVGCGCKEETVRYSLNSYEKSMIPYNETQLLEYKDENIEIIAATASKKEVLEIDLAEDEGCFNNIIESQSFDLNFNNLNKQLYVKIEKTYNNRTIFEIHENNIDELVSSNLYNIENLNTQDLEQNLTNVSIDGFQYNNVFVFKLSSKSINLESEFETIVFSPQEGIVHLKRRTGGYLKLN